MAESVLSRVASSADGDLFDEGQVIGGPDLCAATRVVCQDGDRSDRQAEGPGDDRVACLVVDRPAVDRSACFIADVSAAPAAWRC